MVFIGVLITGTIIWYLEKKRKYTSRLMKSNRSLDHAIGRLRRNEAILKTSEYKLKTALQSTELERSRLKDAIESLEAAIAIYDADERLIICNQKYRETYHEVAHMILPGVLYREMLEKYFTAAKIDSLTNTSINAWVDKWLKNFRQHKAGEIQRLHDHWLLISDYPTSEGGVVSLRYDITSIKEAERQIHSLNRTHAVLSRSSSSLARAVDEKSLLSAFCDNVVEIGGYSLSMVFYAQQDSSASINLVAKAGDIDAKFDVSSVTQLNRDYADPYASEIAINTEQTIVINNLKKKSRNSSWKNQKIHQAYQSMIALPLKVNEEIIGCFTICSIDKKAFNKEEVSLLEELAEILSLGIVTMRARSAREQKMLRFKNEVERNERKRITATLHDGVAQTMQAVNLNLKSVRIQVGNEQRETVDFLSRIIDNIGSVIEELRTISHDLRPLFLERMGLEEAIKYHCSELSLHNEIHFHISSNNHNLELNEINKEQCFLSFREALNNTIKHAQATRVDITMKTLASDLFSIQIRDNGVGFHTDHKFNLPSGLGLSMISERIQSIGGHAVIRSSPGNGTIVTLIVPANS
jgi:signal transduction histidine kinase